VKLVLWLSTCEEREREGVNRRGVHGGKQGSTHSVVERGKLEGCEGVAEVKWRVRRMVKHL